MDAHGSPPEASRSGTVNRVNSAGSVASGGDPWASIDDVHHDLTPLLELWESSEGGEMNYPPDYPKMPGEPPRVQPSKKVEAHWDADGNRVEE